MTEKESQPPNADYIGVGVEAIRDSPPTHVDPSAAAFAALERLSLENAALEEDVKDRTQDRNERAAYAGRIFTLVLGWMNVVGVIVLLQGFGKFGRSPFHLSDGVMLAILGGTTASVIGIFVIVANYLFPRTPRHKASTEKK